MTRYGVVMMTVALLGCGDDKRRAVGDDAGAGPDAMSCTDSDHDCVDDAHDVCPGIFDPGQVDLDHDGVGWMCDSVETITFDFPTPPVDVDFAVRGSLVALDMAYDCSSARCSYNLLTVGARGAVRARSDSTDPAAAWMTSTPFLHPIAITDDRVMWSRGAGAGDTGDLDLATGTLTVRVDGTLDHPLRSHKDVLALGVRTSNATLAANLIVPKADGTWQTIATAPEGFRSDDFALRYQTEVIPPHALVPVRRVVSGKTVHDVVLFDGATQSVAPVLLHGVPIEGANAITAFQGSDFGMCVDLPTSRALVELTANGAEADTLPFSSCFAVAHATVGNTTVYFGSGTTGTNVAYRTQGAVHLLAQDIPDTTVRDVLGDNFPVIHVQHAATGTIDQYWAIAPDGSATLLADDLVGSLVSVSGDTVHVAGIRAGSSGGTLVVVRYRPSTGRQEIAIGPRSIAASMRLITTREGAALVASDRLASVVRSQSMQVSSLNLGDFELASVRKDSTVIVSTQDASHPASQRALYAYDEVNGAPRVTVLTAESNSVSMQVLDRDSTQAWFLLIDPNQGCSIARIVAPTGVPQLDRHAISTCQATVWGRDLLDRVVVETNGGFSVAGPTTLEEVARGTELAVIFDEDASPKRIVGWTGLDAMGRFSCLASHPERCWASPTNVKLGPLAGDSTGDGAFTELGTTNSPDRLKTTLTFVRSVGQPDRPQPLL